MWQSERDWLQNGVNIEILRNSSAWLCGGAMRAEWMSIRVLVRVASPSIELSSAKISPDACKIL
jgi:hypothetical protein